MNIDQYGQVIITEDEAINALYSGRLKNLSNVFLDDTSKVDQFNHARNINADSFGNLQKYQTPTITVEEFDRQNQSQWFMPDNYCPNLVEMLYSMCTTQEQTDRVSQELELFIQHGMMDLLYYLKYLVDTMRNKDIVWGVGRGSSVASYVLYLIGIHRIDSIKYNLDIKEFLKGESDET
jgi:DNA polymerase III alpha subunit